MEIPIKNRKGEIVANAIVSEEDYEHLIQFKWCKSDQDYVCSKINKKSWKLHRYIMIELLGNDITPKQPIDHINNNPLDNTRENLRIVTISENARNQKKVLKENTTSKYIGVSKNNNIWSAEIRLNHDKLYASYVDEIHAAYQYNLWVEKYNLKTAKINDIEIPDDFIEYIPRSKELPKGIYLNKKNKYIVKQTINYIRKHIGTYSNLNDAIIALEKVNLQKQENLKEKLYKTPILYNENGDCIFKINEIDILIDKELYYDIIQYKWHVNNYGYVIANINKKDIRLHRYIMNYSEDDFIDHINGDKLDNRKSNLRIATPQQNSRNTSSRKNSTSQYLGVYFDKSRNKFLARISINNTAINLGRFVNEIDAAKARDKASKKHFGDFARLNFPDEI